MRASRLPQFSQLYDGLCRAMRFCHAALVNNTATDAQLHETALLSSFASDSSASMIAKLSCTASDLCTMPAA